jgi:catechol 2,3-dioxygenase-like lactoylglutathione lyase family enzyme
VALEVDSIERSLAFWQEIAGLEVSTHEGHVSLGGYIALIPRGDTVPAPASQLSFPPDGHLDRAGSWILIFVGEKELAQIRDRLERAEVACVSVSPRGRGTGIRCTDPDGHVVEFRERNDFV